MNPKISMIAAIGKNRELGRGNELIFKIPEDMKFFREKTRGHTVIMGRKTYESIRHPLLDRTNIIITRDVSSFLNSHPECSEGSNSGSLVKPGMTHLRQGFGGQGKGVVVSSIDEALEFGRSIEHDELFVIGGAQIYNLALPYADKLYLTLVNKEVKDADAFFPDYSMFTKILFERRSRDNNYSYTFIDLTR